MHKPSHPFPTHSSCFSFIAIPLKPLAFALFHLTGEKDDDANRLLSLCRMLKYNKIRGLAGRLDNVFHPGAACHTDGYMAMLKFKRPSSATPPNSATGQAAAAEVAKMRADLEQAAAHAIKEPFNWSDAAFGRRDRIANALFRGELDQKLKLNDFTKHDCRSVLRKHRLQAGDVIAPLHRAPRTPHCAPPAMTVQQAEHGLKFLAACETPRPRFAHVSSVSNLVHIDASCVAGCKTRKPEGCPASCPHWCHPEPATQGQDTVPTVGRQRRTVVVYLGGDPGRRVPLFVAPLHGHGPAIYFDIRAYYKLIGYDAFTNAGKQRVRRWVPFFDRLGEHNRKSPRLENCQANDDVWRSEEAQK